ncbi:MAG: [Protein-PII] uridylyltransferase [Labilithrix sp.]|nr:[Protein-PII] uridylyltransferase [Labilithrix sp.]
MKTTLIALFSRAFPRPRYWKHERRETKTAHSKSHGLPAVGVVSLFPMAEKLPARATGPVSGRALAADPLIARVAGEVRSHWAPLEAQLLGTHGSVDAAGDGLRLGVARAAVLAELLQRLHARAATLTNLTSPVLLAAVGSFGRGAVALRSDIDVRLLVRPGAQHREAAALLADALLYPLWDAGLSVGHQVVDTSEVLELAQTDLATATSLLDMRHIAGDADLLTELEERAYAGLFSQGELTRFAARLEEEATARHARFGGSLYLLEPEVKAGAGGLRDLDIGRWAARARYRTGHGEGNGTWAELVRVGVLVPREAREIASAEEFLWRVRNRLHAHARRKSDRLTFDQQEAIALEMGYAAVVAPDAPVTDDAELPYEVRAAAAERFMQDYFGHARVVSRARESLLLRATPPRRRGRPVDVDLGGGVRLFDGQVTVDPSLLASDPALALRAYASCVSKKAPILPYARDLIARATSEAEWAARLRASPEAARLFVSLLCTVPEVPLRRGSIAGELHEVGLLLAMIPEFAPVTGRVHHDVYHVYTVDVHSVAAVDALRAICRGENGHERPLASRLAAEIANPVPLFLATLLHDVGKGYPDASGSRRNHSVTGAELCDVILPRLGISADEAAEVRQLVIEHLLMYHVATRRDLDDATTTADFCAHLRGREGLRNLYLLTICDLTTTSPTALTSWKARMLDELYFAADAAFAGTDEFGAARIQRVKEAALALWTHERADLEHFLASMPERYLLSNAPEAIVAHGRISAERLRTRAPVLAALVPSRHPEVTELCVVAEDAPGLLARIAAAITASRLEVLGAQVYSRAGTSSGPSEAVDLFWVRDSRGSADGVAQAMPRLARDLAMVCSGTTSGDDLLRDRIGTTSPWRERPSPEVLPEVVVDDRASPSHTVIEVFAKDRPGLLYALANALHGLRLGIALSKINTEGTKVADVFYVNELDGSKVVPGPRFRVIRDVLLGAVSMEGGSSRIPAAAAHREETG